MDHQPPLPELSAELFAEALRRTQAEFREMPGLKVTEAQVARLLGCWPGPPARGRMLTGTGRLASRGGAAEEDSYGRRSNETIRALSRGTAVRRAAVHAALWRSFDPPGPVHQVASANASGGVNPSKASICSNVRITVEA